MTSGTSRSRLRTSARTRANSSAMAKGLGR